MALIAKTLSGTSKTGKFELLSGGDPGSMLSDEEGGYSPPGCHLRGRCSNSAYCDAVVWL